MCATLTRSASPQGQRGFQRAADRRSIKAEGSLLVSSPVVLCFGIEGRTQRPEGLGGIP